MTIMEAAKLWNLSPNWIRALIRSGRLPARLVPVPVPYYDIPDGTPRPGSVALLTNGRKGGDKPVKEASLKRREYRRKKREEAARRQSVRTREEAPVFRCNCSAALLEGKVPSKETSGEFVLAKESLFDTVSVRRTDAHCDFCGERSLVVSFNFPEDPDLRNSLERALEQAWSELVVRVTSGTPGHG